MQRITSVYKKKHCWVKKLALSGNSRADRSGCKAHEIWAFSKTVTKRICSNLQSEVLS